MDVFGNIYNVCTLLVCVKEILNKNGSISIHVFVTCLIPLLYIYTYVVYSMGLLYLEPDPRNFGGLCKRCVVVFFL